MVKGTTELLNELKAPKCSLDKYLSIHNNIFVNEDIKSFWAHIIKTKNISKSKIIDISDFSYCYFYDVINGRKIPTKDKIIRLALAMEMSFEDCQKALNISGHSALSPDNRRDSILIYSIEHKETIMQCNNLLNKYGEEELK